MTVKLDWKGAQVMAKAIHASQKGIDETTEAAASDAASNHWWRNQSGHLEGEIQNEKAVIVPRPKGRFGITSKGFYGFFLERKTPFMRPAADREFPKLAGRIKRHFRAI